MSTFYVLPPRPQFGDHLAAFLQTFLPGLDWDVAARVELADAVAEVAVSETDAFLIFRDDLAAGEGVAQRSSTGSVRRRTTKSPRCASADGKAPAVTRWRIGDRLPPSAAAA